MIQLRILSGRRRGDCLVIRRFPCWLGREASCDFQLEEDGVWARHLKLNLDPVEGCLAESQPNAIAFVNGHPLSANPLRSGDLLEIGSVKLQFGLSDTRLRNLRWREGVIWFCIGLLSALQLLVIYGLGS